jgi:hypothetical protein
MRAHIKLTKIKHQNESQVNLMYKDLIRNKKSQVINFLKKNTLFFIV